MAMATRRYFRGTWQMVRIIEDAREGVIGEFWGECSFTPEAEGLACAEAGVLRFRGEDYHAERKSLWRFPGPGLVEVDYEDGRPFHAFSIASPRAEHVCGEDTYSVEYRFDPDAWISVWKVEGPNKAYQMTTRFVRLSGEPWGGQGVDQPAARRTSAL